MSDEYEKSCQYCSAVIEDDDETVETGHGNYHRECHIEIYGHAEVEKFLKKKGVYGEFMGKFERDLSNAPFDEYCDETPVEDYVIEAFGWGLESDLWSDVHDKWYEVI